MAGKVLEINLFGPCVVRKAGQNGYEITGTKHKALFALLATAPFGRRTRSFLQDTLWGQSTFDSGRQSLRRAVSDIKALLGEDFEDFLTATHSELTLTLQNVRFLGRPGGATFLEGLDIREHGFEEWLNNIRQNPSQIYGLFSTAHQPPPPSILPTVAVVPFRLISSDQSMSVMGDFVAEEVCRSLSKSSLMSVISHMSARQLSVQNLDTQTIQNTLGAHYCLNGSLRTQDLNATLDADFIDTSTGRILWTRSFTAPVADFLSSKSEAIAELTTAVGRMIASDTVRYARGRHLSDLEDHRLLLAGVGMMHELKLASFAKARQLIEESVARAPHAAEPLAWLGDWYIMSIWNGWSSDAKSDALLASEFTQRALDLDPDNSLCLAVDGVVHSALNNSQGVAEKRFSKALEVNPNDAMSWLFSGVTHAFRDNSATAVEYVEKAHRLSPIDPLGYLFHSFASFAHVSAEEYEQAVELADLSLELNARHVSTLRTKLCAHYHLDQHEEMMQTGQRLRRQLPYFDLEEYRQKHPAADYDVGRRMVTALQAAGF
ncbi:hypothetical protein [uncultured Tateyamaria sp.]|uniref:hypothetical protein n=1 Tax=uncultured Tateyamaria sp. TaxID=455651 RepID=UPI002610DBFC|nr:hypothetical protein [uncultured Tateyamaria sp.]